MKRYIDKSPFLYILCSLAAFESLNVLLTVIGSFDCGSSDRAVAELLRMLPVLLTTIGCCLLMTAAHWLRFYGEADKKKQLSKRYGAWTLVFGAASLVYTVVTLFAGGTYRSLVEGYPYPLFPLDTILTGALEAAIGISLLCHSKRIQGTEPPIQPVEKGKRTLWNRLHYNSGAKPYIGWRIFAVIFVGVALVGCGAGLLSPFLLSWSEGHTWYNITLMIVFLIPTAFLALWKFRFLPLKGKERMEYKTRIGLLCFALGFILTIFYITALKDDMTALMFSASSLMPLDFFSGKYVFWIIFGIANTVPPFIYFCSGLREYGKTL